jgi:hypothetical protein
MHYSKISISNTFESHCFALCVWFKVAPIQRGLEGCAWFLCIALATASQFSTVREVVA